LESKDDGLNLNEITEIIEAMENIKNMINATLDSLIQTFICEAASDFAKESLRFLERLPATGRSEM